MDSNCQCRILIIEDNAAIRDALKLGFEIEGKIVNVANDGLEGLAALETDPLPNLIILDLLMPRLNGFEFLNLVRAKKTPADLEKIPVIALSAVASHQRQNIASLVDYIFSKPVDFDELYARVNALCP
jgi:two-component system, chemotaxis family, chemotaxis protein CheY